MKKLVIAIVAVGGLAAGGYALASATSAGSQTYKIDHQQFQWRKDRVATTSTKFHNLKLASTPGAAQFIIARGPISAVFSGTFKGGPVEIRVTDVGRKFHPSTALFRPPAEPTSFSYSFVSHGSSKSRCHYVGVKWRSVTGAKVTMTSGDLIVTYREKAPKGSFVC